MIRLKDILNEITLGSVTPYANRFVWRDNWGDGESYETKFWAKEGEPGTVEAVSQPVMMTMTKWKSSKFSDSGEWQFAYFVRTGDANSWTTTTQYSAATGQLNPFRLFRTLGEAIREFAGVVPGVDVIDITGSDTYDAKGAQKSRIYADFLRTNPGLSEFDVMNAGRGLYLVRRGVTKTAAPAWAEDPDAYDAVDDDYWTPDGSEDTSTDSMGMTADIEER